MLLIFALFDYQKWFDYEAQALIPFIRNGPLTSWMYPAFDLHGAIWFLGVSEWLTATLLAWGFWNPRADVLGAILSVATFITTLTIIPFMPDGWDATAGFPAMKGNVAFLMKDIVLLAVSVYVLKLDVARLVDSGDTGAAHAGGTSAGRSRPLNLAGRSRTAAGR